MKKPIALAALLVVTLAAAALWFTDHSRPRQADQFTRTQSQHELNELTNELQMLRVMLDGPEAASTSLLEGYTQQLARLAAKPQDTQEHRDLVQRLTQAITTEQDKIHGFQQRRRSELVPLEQRVMALQQQVANL